MKKKEIEILLEEINEIKGITDRQEYIVTKAVNEHINKMKPLLNKELKRLDNVKAECNKPCFWLSEVYEEVHEVVDLLNQMLEKLVLDNFVIIDYGVKMFDSELGKDYSAWIKYTS